MLKVVEARQEFRERGSLVLPPPLIALAPCVEPPPESNSTEGPDKARGRRDRKSEVIRCHCFGMVDHGSVKPAEIREAADKLEEVARQIEAGELLAEPRVISLLQGAALALRNLDATKPATGTEAPAKPPTRRSLTRRF